MRARASADVDVRGSTAVMAGLKDHKGRSMHLSAAASLRNRTGGRGLAIIVRASLVVEGTFEIRSAIDCADPSQAFAFAEFSYDPNGAHFVDSKAGRGRLRVSVMWWDPNARRTD